MIVMSQINFINTPFPDNHDGFDYSPKSYTDVQREEMAKVREAEDKKSQNKLMSMFASLFK